tara:strand:+ start:135 stop:431 length:297 start_codon:yes stop_codon:yes gene_type:complete
MKTKVILLFLFLIGCNEKSLEPETFEIKDKITKNIHIFRKEPKLKKSILYCIKDKERKVVWVDWHPDQTPEFTYRVDSYANYIERTWVEQHYGYRIAP